MEKSQMVLGKRANWYRDLKTRQQGDYFGSLSSLYPNEVFVTYNKEHVVTRTDRDEVSVIQNVCLHAGMEILNQAGTQHGSEIRCSGHQWLYDMRGKLLGSPKFCKSERVLARPKFSVWNGFVIGYSKEELGALDGFGGTLGLPQGFLSADEYWFGGKEKAYLLPYPKPLMEINYNDGLHIPFNHKFTFATVMDEGHYVWELGPEDTNCSYSIQVVKVRPDIHSHVDKLMRRHKKERSELGWADLHFWLEENMPDIETPIDKNIFAVWASIYGNGYIMPELYEGGRFLALSYLLSSFDEKGNTQNYNYVEYYVHNSVPTRYRPEALEKFIFAYEQSAREDDGLCEKTWSAHRRDDIDSDRIYHETLEAAEPHYRNWFLRHFVA